MMEVVPGTQFIHRKAPFPDPFRTVRSSRGKSQAPVLLNKVPDCCCSEHLFNFRFSVDPVRQSSSTAMQATTQSTRHPQGEGSALTFQLIDVHKVPGKSFSKLPKVIEGGSLQDSPPAVMLWSGCSKLIV